MERVLGVKLRSFKSIKWDAGGKFGVRDGAVTGAIFYALIKESKHRMQRCHREHGTTYKPCGI